MTRDLELSRQIIIERLMPYTEAARQWWEHMSDRVFKDTSCFPIEGAPSGMFERCCRSPNQSCVPGIQAFPIVAPAYVDWPSMAGGVMSTLEYIARRGLVIEEFTLIPKRGLQTTLRNGFFLCYIPTKMLQEKVTTRWVYMTHDEIVALTEDIIRQSLKDRVLPYANKYYKGETT